MLVGMICSEGEIPLTARNLEFVCSCGSSVGITTISNTRGLQFDFHQPLWTWTCTSSTLGELKKKENRTGFSHRSYRDCKSIWLKEHCSWCRGLVYKNVLGNSFVGQMAKWRGMFFIHKFEIFKPLISAILSVAQQARLRRGGRRLVPHCICSGQGIVVAPRAAGWDFETRTWRPRASKQLQRWRRQVPSWPHGGSSEDPEGTGAPRKKLLHLR